MARIVSEKIDFKTKKNVTRNKGGLFIMIKISLPPEIVTIINTYIPSNWAPKYKRQKLIELKEESDNSK